MPSKCMIMVLIHDISSALIGLKFAMKTILDPKNVWNLAYAIIPIQRHFKKKMVTVNYLIN